MEDKKYQKSYFDVLAICCSSEVPLIVNMLSSLDGVQDVKVIVPSRTVIVIHDNLLISDIQIVKVLNQARLEANIRVYGQEKHGKKWPMPYTIVCGILVAVSTFKFIYHPLEWIALGAIVIGIPPILFRSFVAVRNCTFDVNILGLIAVGSCCGLRDFWEGGTIVFLYTIAEWLQSRASHKANVEMSSLMSTPQKAVLAETGETIAAKDIVIDTILAVKAGEVIPIDGVVVEGNCEVDEKTLTGESLPVPKQVQSIVWAGTINLNGYISVKTTALAEDCVVAKMAKLVEEAHNSKSKTQRLVDKFAKYYTPALLLAAIGLIAVPAALGKHNLKHWARLALVVLVSACPCALILSTPVATFCAFTKAAKSGILIKGGDYLEVLADIKVMAFDKTGTLTRGEFSVSDFRSIQPDVDLNTLLYWVSSIESKASHPMAVALVDYGWSKSLEPKPENVKEFQDFPGEGIYGEIDGKCIYVGNKKIARRAGCETVPSQGDDRKGETFGYIFSGEDLLGVFSMADTCRSGVQEAITELKSLGIKTAMLTGDSYTAAMQVQAKLGHALDEVHAELLPEEKVKIIKDLKKEGPTAMIGDGVNDAPALATANIGISMGIAGSAMAIETGQITLMSNDIRKVPQAIRLGRRTRWKIRQNVALSFVTKAAVLTSAFCGYPFLWLAVFADVGTCLLVIINSMLILQGTTTHRVKCHKFACAPDNTGHGLQSGCGHDKHGCGSKDTHNLHSSVSHIHKRSCSHGDPPSVCGHKKDHQTYTPRSPCQIASPVSLAKCNGHRGCSTDSHETPSHVIQINKVDSKVDTCKNHSNGEHNVCTKQVDTPYHCSRISQHTKNACQGHSCSVSSEMNNLDEDQSLKQVCEGHTDHLHEDLNKKHHHRHHHHQLPCQALNHNIKTTTLNGAGCLHNRDRHVDCQAEASVFNEPNNCIMGMCCEELNKVMHTCASLEKRGSSDCCSKSFRRECGGMHGTATGVLTEIITE
ncbi:Cadmium/zinc-transporting ATPase HMA2 [Thalictrum thalictroides]|uniref:Cadmium/zinc-transporting ATPase HMA2 n=1 Tax=Thalictrum thalictroides TaxID=46969 RepID=A0A7J6W1K9_THATH|nr:Cadmium/zinc-transporting ATPase HMA2 [Thalictrum thalictroides]